MNVGRRVLDLSWSSPRRGQVSGRAADRSAAADVIGSQIVPILPRLRRFALGLCRSQADADDLVQAACERALAHAQQYRPGTRLDSWMYRIIQNIHIDRLRSTRSRGVHDQLDENLHAFPGADTASPVAAGVELGEVERAILRLPEEQRAVLMLVCVEGQSYRETAEILSIPIGTVMSRLARARRQLAVLMEPAADAGGSEP